jgi:type IX secretion system substrate protein
MNSLSTIKSILFIFFLSLFAGLGAKAQVCEWRLIQSGYNTADPDAAGPAVGSATFTLQVRTTSGAIPNINLMTTGYSYQSANAMVPASVVCSPAINNPGNITVSPEFAAGGFTYTVVNQCNSLVQTAGGRTFDRTAAGTLDASGAGVTLTTAWKDAFTVTLWTLAASSPEGGYVMINSGAGGSPGELGSYIINDAGNEYVVNSLTHATPLPLSGALPVLFSQFDAKCSGNGTLISWATAQESNSDYFEVQRSTDGSTWKPIGRTPAAGNSSGSRTYNQLDLEAGNAMYRIKQVDKDGQAVYTNIERANCEVKNISSVIYPVPAKDVLNVVIKSDRSVRTQLMVFEVSGKLVRKLDANIQNGANNFRISLDGLPSGDYILKSSDAAIELNKRFNIIK